MEDLTLEEKCENLMNVVVESRKRFGKRCAEYERKTAVVENQLLNLQINTISNCKPKHQTSPVDVTEMRKDVQDFTAEILERQRRIEKLKKKVKDTQDIVFQLKKEGQGRMVLQPSTAEAMLARAKLKQGT